MRRAPLVLCLLVFLLLPTQNISGQARVEFSDLTAAYKYGEEVTFQVKIKQPAIVKDILLLIRPQGQDTILEQAVLNPQGEMMLTFDLKQRPFRPFAPVEYWLRVTTTTGEKVESTHQVLFYEDNLQPWQRLEEGRFLVNWRDGDQKFGQAVLNAAIAGQKAVAAYLPLPDATTVRIYVYPSARELQSALVFNQQTWVAGHTSPDLGLILLSIPPGLDQQLEMDRQIPHELAHIALYQLAGSAYTRLPLWLNEGIASLAELNPNPEYRIALERSSSAGHIIPMETLCGSFPGDASSAFLAYAQSASFIRFFVQKFGTPGLTALINQYKNGIGCLEGVQSATGSSLAQLQSRWQQESLGMNTTSLAIQNLAPYLIIGALLLLLPLSVALKSLLVSKG